MDITADDILVEVDDFHYITKEKSDVRCFLSLVKKL